MLSQRSMTIAVLGVLAGLLITPAFAAEVRGQVSLQQAGLFRDGGTSIDGIPVSVALLPADGQALPSRRPQQHDLVLQGNQVNPVYLAISRGDSLIFENSDQLYHELFAHSHSDVRPIEIRTGSAGDVHTSRLVMTDTADWHWFCRIHSKTYARVDVVDTPWVRMVRSGELFEFAGIPEGKWLVRIAAPGAETRVVETLAMTAPPPLQLKLPIKGMVRTGNGLAMPQTTSVEQLFPSQPGR